jgi:disintegrin and metalloproteinase domain-containing protein 17
MAKLLCALFIVFILLFEAQSECLLDSFIDFCMLYPMAVVLSLNTLDFREIFIFSKFSAQLQKNLKYFETLHADEITHKIVKRGIKPSLNLHNKIREVEFTALGKKFKLILHPHRDVLHQNFRAYTVNSDGNETIVHLDQDSFFRGRVFGEVVSHVSAHIDDSNVLTATIILPEETYHIEPSWRHLEKQLPGSSDKHMVAYKASDVKLSWEHHNENKESHDNHHFVPGRCGYVKEGAELEADDDDEIEEPEVEAYGGSEPPHGERRKRQADQYEYTPTKTRCPLLLVADYRFFQEMGSSNTKTTISYLVMLLHLFYSST